jgi:carotenoid cleavage dioxygenase
MKTGAVKEEKLFDRRLEFPRVADQRMGQKQRFGFCLDLGDSADMEQPDFRGNLKVNFETGETQLHETGPGRNSTEAVFVPAEGADPNRDEGYVMSYVHDESTGKTDFVALDATDMTKASIAKVTLPQRVPYGFHGNFIAVLPAESSHRARFGTAGRSTRCRTWRRPPSATPGDRLAGAA